VGKGAASDFGFGVGGTLRYSMGRTLSLLGELGYVGIGTQGATSSSSGPLAFGGVELRLPFSRFASDAVLLRGGLGFERYVVSGTREGSNYWLGRFALGYRHVFGPSLAFDLLFDGGPAYFIPEVGDNLLRGYVSGSAAILVAF
jgi:hypothetical protein